MTTPTAQAVVRLGALSLRFGRVDRITRHEDGIHPESDTDHTVMLGLVACAFAAKYLTLDVGLVAQYALVHDLVEAYVGDTPTLRLPTPEQRQAKADREAGAMLTMAEDFGMALPWVARTVARYERQDSPEAGYVRAMDKMLPKITHALNGGATILAQQMDQEELLARWAHQREELLTYPGASVWAPDLFDLRQELLALVLERMGWAA